MRLVLRVYRPVAVRYWSAAAAGIPFTYPPTTVPEPTVPATTIAEVIATAPNVSCSAAIQGNTATEGADRLGGYSQEVFYRLVIAGALTRVSVSTCGSTFDTTLALFSEHAVLNNGKKN